MCVCGDVINTHRISCSPSGGRCEAGVNVLDEYKTSHLESHRGRTEADSNIIQEPYRYRWGAKSNPGERRRTVVANKITEKGESLAISFGKEVKLNSRFEVCYLDNTTGW